MYLKLTSLDLHSCHSTEKSFKDKEALEIFLLPFIKSYEITNLAKNVTKKVQNWPNSVILGGPVVKVPFTAVGRV